MSECPGSNNNNNNYIVAVIARFSARREVPMGKLNSVRSGPIVIVDGPTDICC